MSTIDPSDEFLVQRGTNTYKQRADSLMSTINADTSPYDYLLIQRGTSSFKVSAKDVKEQLGGGGDVAPILDSVTLEQDLPVDANRYTGKSFTTTTTVSGGAATTLEMTGTVTGALGIKAGSEPITANAYPGTSSTDVVLTLAGETNLDVFEVGDAVTANASYTPETDTIETVGVYNAWLQEAYYTGQLTGASISSKGKLFDSGPASAAMTESSGTIAWDASSFSIFANKIECKCNGQVTVVTNNKTYVSFSADAAVPEAQTITFENLELIVSVSMFAGAGVPGGGNSSYGVSAYYIKVDDRLVVDQNIAGAPLFPLLTLESEKDIELFQTGDVVQAADGGSWVSGTFEAGYPGTYAFDGRAGDAGDAAVPNSSPLPMICRWEGRISIPANATVTAKVWAQNGTAGGSLRVNDVYVTPAPTGGNANLVEIDITSAAGTVITSLEIRRIVVTNGGIGIAAILIDGVAVQGAAYTTSSGAFPSVVSTDVSAKTITVDGGEWSDGTNGSPTVSLAGGAEIFNGYPVNNVINNPTKDEALFTYIKPNVGQLVIELAAPLTGDISYSYSGGYTDLLVNDVSKGGLAYSETLQTHVVSNSDPVSKLTFDMTGFSASGWAIRYIEIGGVLLIAGATTVKAIYSKMGSGTISDITGAQVTITPFTDNCFKEGQYLAVDKTINVDPKTDKINSYNDTSKTITVDGTTDLNQLAAGDSVFMTDNSSSGASTKTGYKLVTADIKSVGDRPPFDWNSSLSRGGGVANPVGTWNPSAVFDGNPDTGLMQRNQTSTSAIPYVIWSSSILSDFFYAETAVVKCTYSEFNSGPYIPSNRMVITYLVDAGTPGATELQLVVDGTDNSAEYANSYKFVLPRPDLPIKELYMASMLSPGDRTWPQTTFYFIGFDGEILQNNPVGSLLTFEGDAADNKDLKYFKAGDEVVPAKQQTVSGTSDASIGYSQSFILLDGTTDSYTGTDLTNFNRYLGHGASNGPSELIVFDPPITHPTNNIHLNCFLQPNAGTITVNVGQPGELTLAKTANSTWGHQTTGSKTLYNFRFDGRTSATAILSGVQYVSTTGDATGRVTTEFGKEDPVNVVSVDTTNNTMTVSGGAWEGSDGSGSDSVDLGWNQDQTWSANVTNDRVDYPAVNAFDGSDATISYANNLSSLTVAFTTIPVSTLRVYVTVYGAATDGLLINGDSVRDQITGTGWNEITGITQLTSIAWKSTSGTDYLGVRAVEVDGQMLVDAGTPGAPTPVRGETKVEYQTTGGTGTIATDGIDITNKTITLTAGEDGAARWISDNKAGTEFRVATASKPAVATTAYLKFNAAGAVTGYQATPVEPRAMDNKTNPRLIFPATFPDTGTAPDAEFADANAYIQTSVQLKNNAGDSATKASNQVVPQTNVRLIGPGEVGNNADEIKAMGMQIATHDQRVADHTAAKRQQKADQLQAALNRYSS